MYETSDDCVRGGGVKYVRCRRFEDEIAAEKPVVSDVLETSFRQCTRKSEAGTKGMR